MEALLPSCSQAKAVSLPTVNHEEGGRSALQRVERAAALHRALHISMDVEQRGQHSCTCSTQGLLAEQTVEEMYSFS